MIKEQKLEKLHEAMNLIEEALNLVDDVVGDMPIRANYEAYGKYGFSTLLGSGNPYDSSLHSIIDEVEKLDSDENDEIYHKLAVELLDFTKNPNDEQIQDWAASYNDDHNLYLRAINPDRLKAFVDEYMYNSKD